MLLRLPLFKTVRVIHQSVSRPAEKNLLRALALGLCMVIFGVFGAFGNPVQAQDAAFRQAVAEAASSDQELAAFYRANDFGPVWTEAGDKQLARRQALLQALAGANDHGLPEARYDRTALLDQMRAARTPRDLGLLDVALSHAFLRYAQDVQSGILDPGRVVEDIKRKAPRRDRTELMQALLAADPAQFMRALPPQSGEYVRLMKEKLRLERVVALGGWGPKVGGNKLEPGDSGPRIVELRNRLIALGYMDRSATREFDAQLQKAVQAFQIDHGLLADGVAGKSTLGALNVPAEQRLKSVIVAMERERWLNLPEGRGERHILVVLNDYHARIIDDGKVTFKTRSVVGANSSDRRSPEFSDVMEHMIVNPTWNVPRSIAVKEYLPMLQKDPNAVGHLRLIDGSGRTVAREGMDFTEFSNTNFPFDIKQAPGNSNALGLVKFMFPNRHNIYLHDTPQKSLFARERRAFSHGCIRLQQPFDFAYALLALQEDDPKRVFKDMLNTGRETQIDLNQHVPVHLIYRTAYTNAKGPVQYRADVYGRDAQIWEALSSQGVALRSVRG